MFPDFRNGIAFHSYKITGFVRLYFWYCEQDADEDGYTAGGKILKW